ncbi:MAG: dipeptidase, partial [Rhodospirillales bacterium]
MISRVSSVLAAVAIAVSCAAGPAAAAAELTKDRIEALIQRFEKTRPANFLAFVEAVKHKGGDPALANLSGLPENKNQVDLYRVLGVYARLKYENDMIETLRSLVAIPTVKDEAVPQHESPHTIAFGKAVEAVAKRFGLEYRNVGNRIFEVTLAGKSDDAVGVFTHGDVVPADPAKWVLTDGTKLDPFKLTEIEGRLYGRGTHDDKGSITAALFAMAAIKESGIRLNKTIRLMIETTEETGGSGVEYYKERHKLPPYNIVLDGRYPVGVAEKGFGVVLAKFPVREGSGAGATIVAMTGGRVLNKIPGEARAVIESRGPRKLKRVLDAEAAAYVKGNGGNFRMKIEIENNRVILTVLGEAAHSASPHRGVNPLTRLFGFLHEMRAKVPLNRNHFTDAADYADANWGLDDYGAKLGIAYKDPFMGPLTAAMTYLKVKDGALHLVVNPRAPRGKEPEQLIKEIRRNLGTWRKRTGVDVVFDIKIKRYMYRDPKGPWIETLLD